MANIKNENVKVKAKILGNDVTIKSKVGTNDVKVKSEIATVPSATTKRKGIIRIATEQEAIEGIDNTTAITPYTLKICTDTFEFEQGIPSKEWIIEHNLNKHPIVVAVDTSGRTQIPNEIIYDSDNQITVQFIGAFAGKAYLN